jgi:chromosome segregation ATPase
MQDNSYVDKKTQSNYMRFGLNKYQRDFDNLKKELINANNLIKEKDARNSLILQNITALQNTIEEKTTLIKTLEEEQKNISMLSMCEKNTLYHNLNSLKEENTNLSNTNSELNLINTNQKKEINRLLQQNMELEQKAIFTNNENINLKANLAQANDKITEHLTINSDLKNKLIHKENTLNKLLKEMEIIRKVLNSKQD